MQNHVTATIPMEALMAMLNGMSLDNRRWIAEQLTEQVKCEEEEAAKSWEKLLSRDQVLEDYSNERLYAALSRFHKDWGGDGSPMEIANELRQSAEAVRDVNTW